MPANQLDLIIQLKAKQDQMARDLARAKGTMGKFTNQMNGYANQIQSHLLTAFGGFAVIQGIKNSTRTMAGFEFQMSKVAAVSRASSTEAKAFSDNAKEIGAVSRFTATEIGKLQEELARLGFSTEQIIKMTDASRQLATVADAELGDAARVVGQMLNAFNLEAEDANRVANVMAESFSKSALDLEKFSTSMASVSAVAKNAGFTIEETTAMIGKLVDNGIDASTAGTQLRNVFLTLTQKGLTLEQALEQVKTAEDQNSKALELFEKRAVPVVTVLANMQDEVSDLTNELSDSNQELQKMTDIMEDNLLTDLAKLTSAWQGFILEVGNTDGARKGLQFLAEFVNRWTDIATGDVNRSFRERLSEEANRVFEELNAGIIPTRSDSDATSNFYKDVYNRQSSNPQADAFFSEDNNYNAGDPSQGQHDFGFADSLTPFKDSLENQFDGLDSLLGELQEGLDFDFSQKISEDMAKTTSELDKQVTHFQGIIFDWGRESQTLLAGALDSIASGIGADQSIKKVFGSLLGTVGDSLQQLGIGLLAEAAALTALVSLNPAAMVAAGTGALVAGVGLKRAATRLGESVSGTGGVGVSVGGGGSTTGTFRASGQSFSYDGAKSHSGIDSKGTSGDAGQIDKAQLSFYDLVDLQRAKLNLFNFSSIQKEKLGLGTFFKEIKKVKFKTSDYISFGPGDTAAPIPDDFIGGHRDNNPIGLGGLTGPGGQRRTDINVIGQTKIAGSDLLVTFRNALNEEESVNPSFNSFVGL